MTRDLALAELRRSLQRTPIDKRFVVLVVLSALVHYGGVAVVRAWDMPRSEPRLVDDSRPVHWNLPAPPMVKLAPMVKPVPSLTPKRVAGPGGMVRSTGPRARLDRTSLLSDPMLRILGSKGSDLAPSKLPALGGWEESSSSPVVPLLREGTASRQIAQAHALEANGPTRLDVGEHTGEHPLEIVPPTPEGMRPTDDATRITSQLRSHMRALRSCYERALKSTVHHGRMLLRLDVDAAGVVSATILEDTLGDHDLANCITRRMSGWSLSVTGPTEFRVPLIFVPR